MTANREKILIVDDLPRNIQIVASILEKYNYDLAGATSGAIALEQLRGSDFDLVLLDIMMPEMSGYEVCKIIKADPRLQPIPVIFLSAKNETDDLVEGFEAGASDYITKPFQSKELITRIHSQLDLRRALKDLKEKNILLKQANDTRDKFFSLMAHDLKAPFNGLIGMSQYIIDSYSDLTAEEVRESIHQILLTALVGAELTSQLLNWARSQTGQLEIHLSELHLNEVIQTTMQLLHENASTKQIELLWEVDKEYTIIADQNMTSTVLRNLLSNAIKFTPEKGRITVSVETNEEETTISVEDSGIGIPKEDYKKMFDLSSHYTRHGTNLEIGTGLGLILCKEFMKSQHGSLSFTSVVDQGSIFYMHFQHPSNPSSASHSETENAKKPA